MQPRSEGPPALLWVEQDDWRDPPRSLQRLRKRRSLHRHRSVALLQRGQYVCQTLDAPADVDRADWAAAVRWQLKDLVDFPVDGAAVDVLAVPEGTSYRAQPQLIAVAAAEAQVRPLVGLAHAAGVPWTAIDIAETALRNLGSRVAPAGRAQALLHCQASHATLVVTWGEELLSTRQFDITLEQLSSDDEASRQRSHDQVGLELQRTLDGIERAYGQVTLARVLVTPMPGVQALTEHLGPLLYVPVLPLDLGELLDLSAVPELAGDALALNRALLAIGAALREEGPD
ncbi:MAG: agglutinin biogenesis protein MshI [Burkholderiaceae bacterium]|nr:agglutinin biogenesis protein MshI [Burkholderiaceae bacterium]